MKKIIIVNNNMKIGGVQKSLCNLLWAIEKDYDVTLLLFSKTGELISELPPSVKVIESNGFFRFLGISQGECKRHLKDYLLRGLLAFCSRLFGRSRTVNLMLKTQPNLTESYDCAISYLHNGRRKSFYGGTQEYVINCIDAKKKIAFLHGDYLSCGANCKENNQLLESFDLVATCSKGCRRAFLTALPNMEDKCKTVCNFHRYDKIRAMALNEPVDYDDAYVNVIIVSRLSHEKGIDRAIKALSDALNNGRKVKLHIVGDGALKSELMNLVKKMKLDESVVFYGEQSNPYKYMLNADLLLMTSYHEAAPMVIDEALCLGVPTLTTNTTSSKEMVEERNCGWVCQNTETALSDTFEMVVSNKQMLRKLKERLLDVGANNDIAAKQFEQMLI